MSRCELVAEGNSGEIVHCPNQAVNLIAYIDLIAEENTGYGEGAFIACRECQRPLFTDRDLEVTRIIPA